MPGGLLDSNRRSHRSGSIAMSETSKSWDMEPVTVRRFRTGFQFRGEVKQVKKAGTLAQGSSTGSSNSLTGSQHDSRTEE